MTIRQAIARLVANEDLNFLFTNRLPRHAHWENFKPRAKIFLDQLQAFMRDLGGEAIVLDHPDGLLPNNDAVRFEVCDIIRRVKPDIIVTHHACSMHKDHMACHAIVTDAWFYAAIAGFERELPPHFARTLYYAENWEDAQDFKPYVYMDVSQGFALWEKAINHHAFTVHGSFPYKEYYSHLKRLRGIEGRKQYCECFMIPAEQMRIVKKLEDE